MDDWKLSSHWYIQQYNINENTMISHGVNRFEVTIVGDGHCIICGDEGVLFCDSCKQLFNDDKILKQIKRLAKAKKLMDM